MKVLVIGGGGREHALCVAIAKSPKCDALFCAPGNAGIAGVATCLPVDITDNRAVLDACRDHAVDFVVIGPDAQLEQGLADAVRAAGVPCFGPSKAAAEIEWSKGYMKDLCARAGVPTAAYARFTDLDAARDYIREHGAPIVVKADGLAAGKGVTVAMTMDDAIRAAEEAMGGAFGAAGHALVIEEYMEGEEVSFFVLSDGVNARFFASAQDHKSAFDGDKGPNTGGMGAYCPSPLIDAAMRDRVMQEIAGPVLEAMRADGRPFSGILYAGLMMTASGPRVVEFNARFGDPETQVMLPLLESDALDLLYACAEGRLGQADMRFRNGAALTVIMATEGYPGVYDKGSVIRGVEAAASVDGVTVYHAGTARATDGDLVAQGGRVLCVTAVADDVGAAQRLAYAAVDRIDWPEGFCRRDIGWRVVGH